MQGPTFLIPIFFFLSTGSILAVYLFTRHRERMAMINKGMQSEEIAAIYARQPFRSHPLTSLKWGMVFVAVGIAALVGIRLEAIGEFGEGVIPALMCLFGGIALVLFYLIARKKEPQS